MMAAVRHSSMSATAVATCPSSTWGSERTHRGMEVLRNSKSLMVCQGTTFHCPKECLRVSTDSEHSTHPHPGINLYLPQ